MHKLTGNITQAWRLQMERYFPVLMNACFAVQQFAQSSVRAKRCCRAECDWARETAADYRKCHNMAIAEMMRFEMEPLQLGTHTLFLCGMTFYFGH